MNSKTVEATICGSYSSALCFSKEALEFWNYTKQDWSAYLFGVLTTTNISSLIQ